MKRTLLNSFLALVLISAAALAAMPAMAQPLSGPPADPQYKYSTPMPLGVATPNKLETRIGTLNFFDGVPGQASTEKIYDNLDFQRAVQAYLLALPVVNQAANRDGILAMGPANTTVPIWEDLVDSRTVELTANNNTPYTWFWMDLRKDRWSSRRRRRYSGWLTTSGTTGTVTSVSRGRTKAGAASTCCCHLATRGTSPGAISSSVQVRSACGRSGEVSSSMAAPSPASTRSRRS